MGVQANKGLGVIQSAIRSLTGSGRAATKAGMIDTAALAKGPVLSQGEIDKLIGVSNNPIANTLKETIPMKSSNLSQGTIDDIVKLYRR